MSQASSCLKLLAASLALLSIWVALVSCLNGQQRRQIVSEESALMSSSGRAASRQRSFASARAINYGHLFDTGHRAARSFDMELSGAQAPSKRRSSKGRRFRSGARGLSSSSARKSRARSAKLSKARAMAAAAKRSQARSMRVRRSPSNQQDEFDYYGEFEPTDDKQQQAKASSFRSFDFNFGAQPKPSCDCKCPEQTSRTSSEAKPAAEPKLDQKRESKSGQLEVPMSVGEVLNKTVQSSQELQDSEEQSELKLSNNQERSNNADGPQLAGQPKEGANSEVSGDNSPKAGLSLGGPSESTVSTSGGNNTVNVASSGASAQVGQTGSSQEHPAATSQRAEGGLDLLGAFNPLLGQSSVRLPESSVDSQGPSGGAPPKSDQSQAGAQGAVASPQVGTAPEIRSDVEHPEESQAGRNSVAPASRNQAESPSAKSSSSENSQGINLESQLGKLVPATSGQKDGPQPNAADSLARVTPSQEGPAKASVANSDQTDAPVPDGSSGASAKTDEGGSPTVALNSGGGEKLPLSLPALSGASQRGSSPVDSLVANLRPDNIIKSDGDVQQASASSPGSVSVSSDDGKTTSTESSSRLSSESQSSQSVSSSDSVAEKLKLRTKVIEDAKEKKADLIEGLNEIKKLNSEQRPEQATPQVESSSKSSPSSQSDQSARTSDLLADKLEFDSRVIEDIKDKKADLAEGLLEAKEKKADLVEGLIEAKEKKADLVEGLIEAKKKKFQPRPEPTPEPTTTTTETVQYEATPDPYESESQAPSAQPAKASLQPPVYQTKLRPLPMKQVYKPAVPYYKPKQLPPKCRAKVDELAHELREVLSLVDKFGRAAFSDLSLSYTTRELLSRKLAKIRATSDESLMAASLGKLRVLNEAAKNTGVELIRLSHVKTASRFEPNLKRVAAKLRRVYGLYRKSCKHPSGN